MPEAKKPRNEIYVEDGRVAKIIHYPVEGRIVTPITWERLPDGFIRTWKGEHGPKNRWRIKQLSSEMQTLFRMRVVTLRGLLYKGFWRFNIYLDGKPVFIDGGET